jgi:hypothetical protein
VIALAAAVLFGEPAGLSRRDKPGGSPGPETIFWQLFGGPLTQANDLFAEMHLTALRPRQKAARTVPARFLPGLVKGHA